MDTKFCGGCKETKSVTEFYRSGQNGLRSQCKSCGAEYRRRWRAKNPEAYRAINRAVYEKYNKHRTRENNLRHFFGISQAEYDALLGKQGGVCAICHETCATGRNLAVDHDHVTGEIRGLLCARCNGGYGFFQENPARLMDAIAYAWETGERAWIS